MGDAEATEPLVREDLQESHVESHATKSTLDLPPGALVNGGEDADDRASPSSRESSLRPPQARVPFQDTMQQALNEGVNLFAQPPRPDTMSGVPLADILRSPRCSASRGDAIRRAGCIPKDYFERPKWSCSTRPTPAREDRRSLETMARDSRQNAILGYLQERGATDTPNVHASYLRTAQRSSATPNTPGSKASKGASDRPNNSPARATHRSAGRWSGSCAGSRSRQSRSSSSSGWHATRARPNRSPGIA